MVPNFFHTMNHFEDLFNAVNLHPSVDQSQVPKLAARCSNFSWLFLFGDLLFKNIGFSISCLGVFLAIFWKFLVEIVFFLPFLNLKIFVLEINFMKLNFTLKCL